MDCPYLPTIAQVRALGIIEDLDPRHRYELLTRYEGNSVFIPAPSVLGAILAELTATPKVG